MIWLAWSVVVPQTRSEARNATAASPFPGLNQSRRKGRGGMPASEPLHQDEGEQDAQPQRATGEVADVERAIPAALAREQVAKRLSVLGRNPFTQAHVYTTATLTALHLSDIEAIREFRHIQVRAFSRALVTHGSTHSRYCPRLAAFGVQPQRAPVAVSAAAYPTSAHVGRRRQPTH
jgi:hypothetical protein